jgi:hypothetical protein
MARWVEHAIDMDNMKTAHKSLFEKPEGKKSLARSWRSQDFNLLKHSGYCMYYLLYSFESLHFVHSRYLACFLFLIRNSTYFSE